MNERASQTSRPTGAPAPVRPQFEFRQRPSAVRVPRPVVVAVSHVLWLAGAVLGVGAALVMLLDLGALQAAVRVVVDTGFGQEQQAVRDQVVVITTAVLVAGGAVGVAQAGVAMRLRAGRGSVRYLLVLLLALSVVHMVLAVGVAGVVVRLALLLAVSCGAVAAVLMYLPAANRWFAAQRL